MNQFFSKPEIYSAPTRTLPTNHLVCFQCPSSHKCTLLDALLAHGEAAVLSVLSKILADNFDSGLKLGGMSICDQVGFLLFAYVVSAKSGVKEIDLSLCFSNSVGNNKLTESFGHFILQFMRGNESITKLSLGGNSISPNTIKEIDKQVKRNVSRVLGDMSKEETKEEIKIADAVLRPSFSRDSNDSAKVAKLFWFGISAGSRRVAKSDLDRVSCCRNSKASSNMLQSVINFTHKHADMDLCVNPYNPSVVEIMSLKHKVAVRYNLGICLSYNPVVVKGKVYMVIENSDRLYCATLPNTVNTKQCGTTQLASRRYSQSFAVPLALSCTHIICIGFMLYRNVLLCQIYNVATNSWKVFPCVPTNGDALSFAAWLSTERYVHVLTHSGWLYTLDVLDSESDWAETRLEWPENHLTPLADLIGLEYDMGKSLIVRDGDRVGREGREEFRANVFIYMLDHRNNTVQSYIRVCEQSLKVKASVLRLYKGKYLYGRRRKTCYSLQGKNLAFDNEYSIKPNNFDFY